MRKSKLERLKDLRSKVLFERFAPTATSEQIEALLKAHKKDPHGPALVEFVREVTRLYTTTWVVPTIDALIETEANNMMNSQARKARKRRRFDSVGVTEGRGNG